MSEPICSSDSIPQGSSKPVTVDGQKWLIYHLSDGFHATQTQCTHLFWPLTRGAIIDDRCVQCPFHHARFDIRSGAVEQWASRPPGIGALNGVRPPRELATRRVVERDGQLYLAD